jgi:hypothetical protein
MWFTETIDCIRLDKELAKAFCNFSLGFLPRLATANALLLISSGCFKSCPALGWNRQKRLSASRKRVVSIEIPVG